MYILFHSNGQIFRIVQTNSTAKFQCRIQGIERDPKGLTALGTLKGIVDRREDHDFAFGPCLAVVQVVGLFHHHCDDGGILLLLLLLAGNAMNKRIQGSNDARLFVVGMSIEFPSLLVTTFNAKRIDYSVAP
jgi:hypothetical protein